MVIKTDANAARGWIGSQTDYFLITAKLSWLGLGQSVAINAEKVPFQIKCGRYGKDHSE